MLNHEIHDMNSKAIYKIGINFLLNYTFATVNIVNVLRTTRDIYIANYCIELLYLKMKTLNTLILFYLNRIPGIQQQATSWASHETQATDSTINTQYTL